VGQRVQRSVEDIDRTIRRIRTSIFQLRGSALSPERGLRQRVLEVVSELTGPLGFTPHVAFAGLLDLALDTELADDAIACVRESLANVAKHARASSVLVDVTMTDGELAITITDDGIGMAAATRLSGIANLRARAENRGGSLAIEPAPGGGTILTWKVNR
jgi:signal transduction histidine kinase